MSSTSVPAVRNQIFFQLTRKSFHCFAIFVPVTYSYCNKNSFLLMLTCVCCAIIIADIIRVYSTTWAKTTEKIFRFIMKPQEKRGKLSGASYMFLGFMLSGYIFERELAITSWIVLIISDALAAISGVTFYAIRYQQKQKSSTSQSVDRKKSFVGFLTFFTSSVIIGYLSLGCTNIAAIIFAAFLSAIVEYYAVYINLDDNFLIPICYCFSFTAFSLL